MERNLEQEYNDMIKNNKVFVFMKGNKEEQFCGFSFRVVNILNELGVDYETFNILEDPEMREAVKQFSNWPTYPQLYINGELLGGCEIIEELYRAEELADQLK